MDSIDITTLAAQVADALGKGWGIAPGALGNGQDAYLTGPDRERLNLREAVQRPSDSGKVEIRASLTDNLKPHVPTGHASYAKRAITATANKGAARIASDIESKLLPVHREVIAAALAKQAETEAAIVARDDTVTKVVAALGGHGKLLPYPDGADWSREINVSGTVYGKLQVRQHGSTIKVNLAVPVDLAVQFAKLISVFAETGDLDTAARHLIGSVTEGTN